MNITSTSDNSPENRRFGFFENLPLAHKLLLAFGALFVFAAIIVVVTLTGLNRTQAAYQDALTQGIEIRNLSDKLSVSLLQARRDEKYSIRVDTADENYITSYAQDVANMREVLKQLAPFGPVVAVVSTGDMTQAQYEADIASLTQNVDAYEKSFTTLANAFQKKGFDEERDYEYQFRIAARNIEAKTFDQPGLEPLVITYYRIRYSEKKYLEAANQLYAAEVHTYIVLLKDQIAATDQLEPAGKIELLTQADAYLTAFDTLVELDKEIVIYNAELSNAAQAVESLAAKINRLGQQLAVDDINAAQANSTQTLTISIITVFIVLVLSILLAVTLSQQLIRPIILLTNTAQEILAGKLDIQAQVNSTDEIGTLAQTFNIMTSQLQGALQNLDRRAKELEQRTVELELTSQQSEKRAQQLQTIAEITQNISTEKDLNKLLAEITQTVSERFGVYHVGIFLLDESSKFAVLLASNSPGGKEMLRRQHSLEVGQVGIVGNVTSTGNPRIALDTGADAIYFNNPDLPQTRSELALPLKIEKQVIGALDIQSTDINAFSDEDVEVLTILADQVSLAIQNARLFNQIEKSLAESNAIQRQYVRETWRILPKLEKLSGFRYTLTGAIPLDDETKFAAIEDLTDKKMIRVPIILRGETIGTLAVQVPNQEHIKADQMDLIKAVAERVALSAENARLFEDTTRRAERERLVSDITTKIRGTNNPEEMIRIAAQEIKNALGVSRVDVLPQKLSNESKS